MREQLKQQLRDMITTLGRAEAVLDSRSKMKDEEAVRRLLEDMQESAMAIGNAIEVEEGLETEVVKHLEEYCELLWQHLTAGELKERFRLGRALAGKRGEISSCLEKEAEGRIVVVFLLCKADRWKQMKRLYDVAKANPLYDCYVLAAPYSERLGEESVGIIHDELGMFPAEAGALDYGIYDMERYQPDMVFMDGPYAGDDGSGIVPDYDFAKVRECAGLVVYMPAYEDESQVAKEDCRIAQVRESDMIIVPSEQIKEAYKANLGDVENGMGIFKKISVMESAEAAGKMLHKLL